MTVRTFQSPPCSLNDFSPSCTDTVNTGGFGNCSILTEKKETYSSNGSNRHSWTKQHVIVCLSNKKVLLPPPLLPSHNISIVSRRRSSPWQLLQSPCSKWMIKKRWRGFTGGWYAWHPKSPRSKLAKRSELQLSSKQAHHPLFISAEILMHVMKGLK